MSGAELPNPGTSGCDPRGNEVKTARRKPILRVRYSRKAEQQLDEIYAFNIEERRFAAADRYINLLTTQITSFASDYDNWTPVETRQELRS
jgi:plasmid stabilization system protein ParE